MSAYMLGMDMGVVDRQASGLQHVGALHLSMHGSWPTEFVPLAGTRMCWSGANSFEEITLSRHGGGETPPFHGYAVREVLEWGKFF